MLQGGLGLHESCQRQLAGLKALLQDADRLPDLGDLTLKPVKQEGAKGAEKGGGGRGSKQVGLDVKRSEEGERQGQRKQEIQYADLLFI